MKGPIFLIFLHKQDLQKMIHPTFCITLMKCLTDCRRNLMTYVYLRAMSTCTHHSALQFPFFSQATEFHPTKLLAPSTIQQVLAANFSV